MTILMFYKQISGLDDDINVSHLKKYSCKHCTFSSNFKEILQKHEKSHFIEALEGIVYSCLSCDYKFKSHSTLKHHVNSKHKEAKYCCNHCQFKYDCKLCDFKSNKRRDLINHMTSIHDTDRIRHNCELCIYKTNRKHLLTVHVASVHEGRTPVVQMKEEVIKEEMMMKVSLLNKVDQLSGQVCGKEVTCSRLVRSTES